MSDSTTSLPIAETPGESSEKTKAGNFFVSNYPPFSFWQPEHVPVYEKVLAEPAKQDAPLGLYIHIPFCRKRCHFCYFRVYTDKNKDEIAAYLEAAVREMELYAQLPVFKDRPLDFIYFGGGTPSYISPKQLHSLVDPLKRMMPWDQAREVAFEAEPGTLTEAKLEAIREIGVTRLSLGIEHFDDHILELNGRAHRSKEIGRAYEYARKIGFPQINIDLIAGMMDDTDEKWADAVERTLELKPDSVTIYQMEVPFNTTIYKQMKEEGRLTAPVADWQTKRRWVMEAYAFLEEAGYTVTSAYTAVRDPEKIEFVYRDALWNGADLLSLGVASFGHVQGVHYQNEHNFDPYVKRLQQGERPVYRALPVPADERLIREFILNMKLGQVGFDRFAQKFGINPRQQFAPILERLHQDGYLKMDDQGISIDREHLLQVDWMLHEFFKPEHQNARYA